MYVLLILLYVLAANGAAIPTGCFVAAWILAGLKLMFQVLYGIVKLTTFTFPGGDKK